MTRRRQRRLRADGPQGARGRARDAASPRPCGWSASRATTARKPAQLSGGQRQRVALARALVNRPRVLLLDEPLGALDLKLREEMQIELKAIQQQVGITFIYVTHDQEEALTMSDRLAVFNAGRIEQLGVAGRRLRAPGDAVRRRVRRDVQPADAATSRERSSGAPGTFTDPAREDPARPSRTRRSADDETAAAGTHPRGRLPRPRHALHRRARRRGAARRHPAEPGDDLDRGARPARQGCPPDLEATARAPRRGWGGQSVEEEKPT